MIGKKLTIFSISYIMATTTKAEIAITGYDPKTEQFLFRKRRQRNQFYLPLFSTREIVFEGWDLPILADHEASNFFRGNACYNLVGEPELIKHYIEYKNLNKYFEYKANIVLVDPYKSSKPEEQESLLYPELTTSHAIINQIKKRQ